MKETNVKLKETLATRIKELENMKAENKAYEEKGK